MSEHDGGQNSNMSETVSLPRSALLADTMTIIQSCALYLLRKGKTSTINVKGSRQKRQMHFRFIFGAWTSRCTLLIACFVIGLASVASASCVCLLCIYQL